MLAQPLARAPEHVVPGRQLGQAAVEFVAALPAILLVLALVWQLALAGHTAWLTGAAARAAARSKGVGGDPAVAARSALPNHLKRVAEVRTVGRGTEKEAVSVELAIPLLLGRWTSPVRVEASAGVVGAGSGAPLGGQVGIR